MQPTKECIEAVDRFIDIISGTKVHDVEVAMLRRHVETMFRLCCPFIVEYAGALKHLKYEAESATVRRILSELDEFTTRHVLQPKELGL